jgi:hypothetical protein
LRLVSSEDRLNAGSLKNFPAPTVRPDFNYCHCGRPSVGYIAWLGFW